MEKSRLVAEIQDVFTNEPDLVHQMTVQGGAGYFNVCGYVTFIKHDDKIYYLACPNEDCRRKVVDNDGAIDRTGRYRCDHCNRSYDKCMPSYMLLAKISDFSDSVFVNFYRQQAETIMNGVTAEQIKNMKEQGDVGAVNELFFETQFRYYTFTIQVKARVYNDEPRLSFACTKVVPHSFAAENKQLLKRILLYKQIPDVVDAIAQE